MLAIATATMTGTQISRLSRTGDEKMPAPGPPTVDGAGGGRRMLLPVEKVQPARNPRSDQQSGARGHQPVRPAKRAWCFAHAIRLECAPPAQRSEGGGEEDAQPTDRDEQHRVTESEAEIRTRGDTECERPCGGQAHDDRRSDKRAG